MKKVLLFCATALPLLLSAVTATHVRNEDQSRDTAILENKFIRAEFSAIGGKLISFKDKRNNVELTSRDVGKKEGGAIRDMLLPNGSGRFTKEIYKINVEKNTPQQATLSFTSPELKNLPFILFKRTVTLDENSTALKVHVELINQQESMADMAMGYWMHNFFGVEKTPTEYIVPTAAGIKKQVPSKKLNTFSYSFDKELIRNWTAMYAPSRKAGVVIAAEYPKMDLIYSWFCRGDSLPLDTLEIRFFTEIVPQGKSAKWDYSLGIVSALTTIDGAGNDGCGAILTNADTLRAELYAFNNIKGSLELYRNNKKVETLSCDLTAGKKQDFSFKTVPGREALRIVVKDAQGKFLFDLLKGSTDGKYRFAKIGKRNQNQELVKEEWDLKVSAETVTPHWKWSNKKLPGKGLFLVPVEGIRDVIELVQRVPFDFDAPTVFPTSYNISWKTVTHFDPGNEKTGTDRVLPLLKNQYSFIVVGSQLSTRDRKWSEYPANVRNAILQQVKNGAGLICFNQHDFTSPVKLTPFKLPPTVNPHAAPWFPQAKFAAATYGKGRIITVQYNVKSFIAPLPKWRSQYFALTYSEHRFQEYQFAILAGLLRKATGMEETLSTVSLNQKGAVISSAIVQEAELELFNRYTESVSRRSIKLKAGNNQIPMDLQAGRNYLHVRTNSGSFGFAMYDNKLSGKLKINMKNSFAKGEMVTGTVECSIPDAKIEIAVEDNEKRILYKTTGNSFSWNQSMAMVNRHQLVAKALVNGKEVATLKKEFYLPEHFDTFKNFPVLVWTGDDSYPEYSYPFRNEVSRQFGFNFLYGASYSAASPRLHRFSNLESGFNRHENGNFRMQPSDLFDPRYHKTQDKKYLTRKWCPSEPSIKNKPIYSGFYEVQHWATNKLFQLGDEMSLTWFGAAADFCYCKYCMAEFRKVMQKKYGSLEKMNEEWKTQFPSWDAVLPHTYTEAMTLASPASYYDFRAFMDQVFIGKLKATRETVRKSYPNGFCGPTGVSSIPGIYGGNLNFWAMSLFDCGSYYKTPRIPASFRREERLVMQYFGYSSTEAEIYFSIWESLLSGCRGINNWYDPTFILPDLRISYKRKYYSDFMWQLRNTAGEIFYHSPKIVDQAAILHSQNALVANYLKTDKVDYYNKELSFAQALEDAGIAYRFIAPEEMLAGVLDQFKVLILPEVSAMSNKEIERVKEFCKRGGIVIADYECALYNENGNARQTPALNEMFGIRNGMVRMRNVTKHDLGKINIKKAFSGIRPTTGKAKYAAWAKNRKMDLVIENQYGDGKAFTLNFAPEYYEFRTKKDGFSKLLAELTGLEPHAKAQTAYPIMHSFFRNKESLIVAMLPAPYGNNWRQLSAAGMKKHAFTAPVFLAQEGHVYDVIQKKYLGYGKEFKVNFIPGTATVLSVTADKPDFEVAQTPVEAKRGQTLKIPVKTGTQERYFVLMRVFRPDGKEELAARQMRTVDPDQTFTLPLPFNAPTGLWRITFDDAASNLHFERKVNVQ